jgi:hypothetical protein
MLLHLWFLPISVHLWPERTIPLCPEHFFQLETLLFHSKRFLFSQDMTISVRSRGIKLEYALLNFYRDNILVFCFFFQVATLFDLCMLFSCALCDLKNQKQSGKGFLVCVCSFRALCVISVNKK